MKYQNTITGYVLDTICEIKGQNWVKLDSAPSVVAEVKEEKPKRKKNGK